MYDAAKALRDAMLQLRVACDGGKDSLSMAATVGGEARLRDLPQRRSPVAAGLWPASSYCKKSTVQLLTFCNN